MIPVRCRTNLDLSNERWPLELPAVPRVGDTIRSRTKHKDFQLELEVVSVEWVYNEQQQIYIPHIELHMTEWQRKLPGKDSACNGSISAFYHWYAPLVGRSVGAFI